MRLRPITLILLLLPVLLLVAAGCGSGDGDDGASTTKSEKATEPEAEPECTGEGAAVEIGEVRGAATVDDLAGRAFNFVEANGCPLREGLVRAIEFTDDRWSAQLTCNTSNGPWKLGEGGELTLGKGPTTLMACEPEDADLEATDLAQVDVTQDGALVFHDADGARVAVATPKPPAAGSPKP